MTKLIQLPGDKSISHRVAMLAALAEGECTLTNFNTGADCNSTLQCLHTLGIEVMSRRGRAAASEHPASEQKQTSIVIRPKLLRASNDALNCGNSGSTIRMLTGLLAGQQIPATLTGDSSLLQRPMKRVAEPLRQMGAILELQGDEYPPIKLIDGAKQAIEYTMPVSSAQVKSAVLFAGLKLKGTCVIESVPTRDHTERLLQHLQIEPGPTAKIPAFKYAIPGDPSSAAFLIVAALIHKKEVVFKNILLNQHRTGFIRILKNAGAPIRIVDERIQQNELIGDIQVQSGFLKEKIVITTKDVAGVIDEIPALTIAGMISGFEVHGAKELRYKESDRITSMTSNLIALGMQVEEWDDGYRVLPGTPKATTIRTFGDHRIAMAFSAAGYSIDDHHCVSISFPEFFDLLKSAET